jgi:WD40 repeat protein
VEKNNIVMRLLEDKASMVSEMNQMNDIIEAMNKKLEEYKKKLEAKGEEDEFDTISSSEAEGHDSGYGASVKSGGWSIDSVSVPPTTLRHQIKAHHTEVNAVIYSPSEPLLFTGSSDGNVKVWECNTARSKSTLRGNQPILTLDCYDNFIAGGSTDRTVKIWDLKTERLRTTITGHSNKVHAVKYSPDGRQLISGSTDRTIKVCCLFVCLCD